MKRLLIAALAAFFVLPAPPVMAQGMVVTIPHSLPARTFRATGDLDNTTDVSIAAAATGVKHCVTSVQVSSYDTVGADTSFRLLSNDTAMWEFVIPAEGGVGAQGSMSATFPVPVCTAAGEALEVDVTDDVTDNLIFYNVQGYSVP